MPSQRAGRCFEGERERKLKMHTTEVFASVAALKTLQESEGRKRQKRWQFLLPMATVVAHQQEQSGREIEPIVRNDPFHTQRGHIEKFSLPAATELGLPTTV